MPKSFPLEEPNFSPEEIEERRKQWEAQKRSSSKPLPNELTPEHSAPVVAPGEFDVRRLNTESVKNIRSQLDAGKVVPQQPLRQRILNMYTAVREGSSGISPERESATFKDPGLEHTGKEIAAAANAFLEEPAQKIADRSKEFVSNKFEPPLKLIELLSDAVIENLFWLIHEHAIDEKGDTAAANRMHVEKWRSLASSIRGTLEHGITPDFKIELELQQAIKEAQKVNTNLLEMIKARQPHP